MDTTTFRLSLAKTYINAMEILVETEVDRRINQLTEGHRAYLNRMEIIAFALNKLPSLYATGEKGLEFQLAQGRAQHAARIQQAVQQSLAAVLRDPILNYTPLKLQASAGMRDVLTRIKALLHNDQIDWETLPDILAALINQTPRGNQIAAINGVLSPSQALTHAVLPDDMAADVTIGMASPSNPNEDKPWKRMRDRLGAKAASTGVTSNAQQTADTWSDSRYSH
jgi:Late competence development protein ComFB